MDGLRRSVLEDRRLEERGLQQQLLRERGEPDVVAQAFNPSTQEAEAGGSLSSRSAWSSERVPGQPGLHKETLSQEKTKLEGKKKKE